MSLWPLLVGILRSSQKFGGCFVYGASYTCCDDKWGKAIHPCWVSDICSTSSFFLNYLMVAWGNLSLQYVNSRHYTFRLGLGVDGGCLWVWCLRYIICPLWWKGVSRILSFSALCLASLFDLSLPHMFVCALTFLMVMLWFEVLMVYMMWAMRILSRWLFWEEGPLIWLSSRYMMLRQSIKIYVFMLSVLVCSIARRRAYNYALKMFENPGSFFSYMCLEWFVEDVEACDVTNFFHVWRGKWPIHVVRLVRWVF